MNNKRYNMYITIQLMNAILLIHKREMFEITSLIIMCCFELTIIGKFISILWRILFDNQLSIILFKLEKIHKMLIWLNSIGSIKTKINWYLIVGIIVYMILNIITPALLYWMSSTSKMLKIMIIQLRVLTTSAFFEYILLILYIQQMMYVINDNILERKSCLSTLRDMFMEILECLNHVNRSIYGMPVIVVFITGNIGDIIILIYGDLIFPEDSTNDSYHIVLAVIELLLKIVNLIVLYGIGHFTEQEINRISLVLHQLYVIERNPRIKRQIKFFILRRLHEHYRFEVYGICRINLRQLLILSNKVLCAYLIIQVQFKLNKN
ncbi:Gustatory receptor [Aphis craccivora]|uniref:Gustatory receptor n=1 Tax=Aphis craccivora TaxID=307492 RepID=A0A6G0VP16_APHCR|nr:Gustatory receptor [Aphis craccivora]